MQLRDSKASWKRLLRTYLTPKGSRRDGHQGLAEPVEPNSPKPLSGGAAAALKFDD